MIESRLYLELLLVAFVLMLILLYNSIFLYKQKLSDIISRMLLFGAAMNAFEILWVICEEHLQVTVLTYIVVGGYFLSFLIFTMLLDQFLIGHLHIHVKKWQGIVFYVIPFALFTLLTVSTPVTHQLFWVDKSGAVHEGVLFCNLFYIMLLAYSFAPHFIVIFFLTIGRRRRPANMKVIISMFVFGIITPILYWLELLVIDGSSFYLTLSLPVSLALVYLVTNVSTHAVLDTRAHIEAVETDLRIASKIQADALPPAAPEFADHLKLNLRGSMNTAKEVGGDFYDYFQIDKDRICFLIADVSGKGTPAALFMMTAKTMIKDYSLTQESTSEIFTAVNARLCENNEAGMFATAWIGILDTRTMTLQYTNAGHNYPVLQRREQPCEQIRKLHGLFLAGMDFTQYRQDEIRLEPGDRLLLYTDGVTEAHNQNNELYGEDRLIEVMENTRDSSGEEVLENILADVSDFAREVPQFDDITMIVLSIKE